ncbi:MAG: undecaprenyldiphospho-muramoylpentapeptide beta-N-acetylglucosaminyltransferase [Clostridiaceae bacterium]
MKKYKILMTGGGSAGHVTPNLALIPKLEEMGYEVVYIGSKNGIEKEIISKENIKYYSISSGKLRRYFDLKNFSDPFKVFAGLLQSYNILRKEKPNIVFSKGGFVAVPVIIASYLRGIPAIAHESDITPGLANKLSIPYCNKVCVTFPESVKHIKGGKGILTGTPIRESLFKGNKDEFFKKYKYKNNKPLLLIIGGSLGSKIINDKIRENIDSILKTFNIFHICGKGNLDKTYNNKEGYYQAEYISENLQDIFQAADIVLSRAGANAIFELLALNKPNLLVPLSKKSSRGDQILNANSFEKAGYSLVLQEEEITNENLISNLHSLYRDRDKFINKMKNSEMKKGNENILKIIQKYKKTYDNKL